MSKRKLIKNRIEAIRLFGNGEINRKEFKEMMKIEETTAGNYEMVINRFKRTGKRPTDKAICKEFFVWADEWEKEHHQTESQQKEQNRRIKYKIELTVWEYM